MLLFFDPVVSHVSAATSTSKALKLIEKVTTHELIL